MPKRSDQRRRTNEPRIPVDRVEVEGTVEIPPVKKTWHPAVRQWWESLPESGQSRFYEPSDWALAYLIAEDMDRSLKPQVVGIDKDGKVVKAKVPAKGASLTAWLRAMGSLLVTEGDRRRLSIELTRAAPVEEEARADVSELEAYRQRLQSS